MIKKININNFRIFENKEIYFGNTLTVLSGHNATGKSTILGLVGNSCEIKTTLGTPLIQNQFRAEWSELFKGSQKFDLSGSNKYIAHFIDKNNNEIEIKFRSTWQEDNTRYRLIPKWFNPATGKSTEAKYTHPIIYLGLSRLYPLAESEKFKSKKLNLSQDEKNWFLKSYISIFKFDEKIENIDTLEVSAISKKSLAGISTTLYDSITNSSGQTNITQVLLSILSFIKQYDSNPTEWNGGILLIDEIEATLHPSAQINLIKFLIEVGKKYRIQTIITTHSLPILEFISRKTKHNTSYNNEIELFYLSKSNGFLDIKRNILFHTIKSDLDATCTLISNNTRKLIVYSEDFEARWFLNKLIPEYISRLHLIDIHVGAETLLTFNNSDPSYFSNTLIIFDGDQTKIKNQDKHNFNKLVLPGNCRPEEVIYKYFLGLTDEHELLENAFVHGYSKNFVESTGPFSDEYTDKDERDRYKKWFHKHLPAIEALRIFDYWKEDNKEEYEEFINQFIIKYNILAERNFLIPIL